MQYVLKPATEDNLGGIKVGGDFEITQDGTLSIKNMAQMREQVTNLSEMTANGKALLASAITDRGVDTETTDTFRTMADNIGKISGGVSYTALSVQCVVKPYTLVVEEG